MSLLGLAMFLVGRLGCDRSGDRDIGRIAARNGDPVYLGELLLRFGDGCRELIEDFGAAAGTRDAA